MFYFDIGFVDAAHAMQREQLRMDLVANNLANAVTPGYKADRMVFDRAMRLKLVTDMRQGPLRVTGRKLDIAIVGKGFFQVRTPRGIRLTRNGVFHLQADGTLATAEGYPVLDEGGAPVVLDPAGGPVEVDSMGQIYQGGQQVGALGIVEPAPGQKLVKEGESLWAGPGGRVPQTVAAKDFGVEQGAIEESNVQVVREMVGMITALRGYEAYQKAIISMQQIDTRSATQVGRVG